MTTDLLPTIARLAGAAMPVGRTVYDLEADPGETRNVAETHPEIVARLEALAEQARDDLGDSARGRKGKNVREPGMLEPQAK